MTAILSDGSRIIVENIAYLGPFYDPRMSYNSATIIYTNTQRGDITNIADHQLLCKLMDSLERRKLVAQLLQGILANPAPNSRVNAAAWAVCHADEMLKQLTEKTDGKN